MSLDFKTRGDSKDPPNPPGKVGSPSENDGESHLESILHRRCRWTGMFVRLTPQDRQLYLPFIERRVD